MRKVLLGITLGIGLVAMVIMPVLASYYAYISVSETEGNSYDDLAVVCPANIDNLVQGGYITSTALDTRVLTGSGDPLPHMVAEDRVAFVTDLGAYEDKSLIFYTGATSLSSFPIVLGYNGSMLTLDDPDLEHSVVTELLVSGLFDCSGGLERNIVYKEGSYKMAVDTANTLTVAWLEPGDTEQWELSYSGFTSGEHTIYVYSNGLVAYLYVDTFDVAKDTVNLFDSTSYQYINKAVSGTSECFYEAGYYWVFYKYNSTNIAYVTSPDGVTWSGETTIASSGSETISSAMIGVAIRNGYVHLAYYSNGSTDYVRYRRGLITSSPSITWSAGWQTVISTSTNYYDDIWVAVDNDNYPYINYEGSSNHGYIIKSSANDGTWATAGGYPFEIYYQGANICSVYDFQGYPNSNELLVIYEAHTAGLLAIGRWCRYYNGSSWEAEDGVGGYIPSLVSDIRMAGDDDGNMWIGYTDVFVGGDLAPDGHLCVRYAGDVWQTIGTLSEDCQNAPAPVYNEDTGALYVLYSVLLSGGGNDQVWCVTLDKGESQFNTPVLIMLMCDDSAGIRGVNPYEDHIGWAMNDNSVNSYHGAIDLTYYTWYDNSNNWTWMQNNVMPYADEIQMAIDGTLQLNYLPSAIVVDDTIPDEEIDHDAYITWGVFNATMGALQTDEAYDSSFYYQNLQPDPGDIIKPEPAATSGDVDVDGLKGNPFYPIIAIVAGTGIITERLAWLFFAWFIVIAAMLGVHLGFDTKPNTEKPQHFILTTITGLGLSILFYSLGIFSWPVILLMCFGLIAAIVWERQPVL